MNEIELLIDFHKDALRQGPGSNQVTARALDFIRINENKNLSIADIGCGTGAQTLTLAEHLDGHITAVDLFPEFLEELEARALKAGLGHRIKTVKASMEDLPLDENTYDIIWSEGAIYNMGFTKGIQDWRKYLKPGGYLAVSEITWTTDSRPDELQEYWNEAYPEIDTASNKIRILEEHGYSPTGYFVLPSECWLDNYYTPSEKRFDFFLAKHHHNELVKQLVENEQREIRIYKKYRDYFSYGFYIARKI